jgi:hypothetical protein
VRAQIEENTRNLDALNSPTETIALELKGICDVLSDPESHLFVKNRRIRIDQMRTRGDDSATRSSSTSHIFLVIRHKPERSSWCAFLALNCR